MCGAQVYAAQGEGLPTHGLERVTPCALRRFTRAYTQVQGGLCIADRRDAGVPGFQPVSQVVLPLASIGCSVYWVGRMWQAKEVSHGVGYRLGAIV